MMFEKFDDDHFLLRCYGPVERGPPGLGSNQMIGSMTEKCSYDVEVALIGCPEQRGPALRVQRIDVLRGLDML
jgi:hypothetical protein